MQSTVGKRMQSMAELFFKWPLIVSNVLSRCICTNFPVKIYYGIIFQHVCHVQIEIMPSHFTANAMKWTISSWYQTWICFVLSLLPTLVYTQCQLHSLIDHCIWLVLYTMNALVSSTAFDWHHQCGYLCCTAYNILDDRSTTCRLVATKWQNMSTTSLEKKWSC